MRETAEQIEALQRLLDESAGRSGGHLTGIVSPERRLNARQLVTALTGMKVLVVATVTANGEPRTSCVDGHFLHGTWLFGTDASAYKARQLKARPAVSVTHADGEKIALFTHGRAEYIERGHAAFGCCLDYFTEHYGSSPEDWGGTGTVFFKVHPKWMVGYAMNAGEFPEA